MRRRLPPPAHRQGHGVTAAQALGLSCRIGMAEGALTVAGIDAIEHAFNRLAADLIDQLILLAMRQDRRGRRECSGAELRTHQYITRAGDDHAAVGGGATKVGDRLAVDQDGADALGDYIATGIDVKFLVFGKCLV